MVSVVYAASEKKTVTIIERRWSFLGIIRNAGSMIAILYVAGSFITRNASRDRQELSVVKRAYKT